MPAKKIVKLRERGKLLDKENWYKKKKTEVQTGKRKQLERGRKRNAEKERQEHPIKAEMFVPYTPAGELAKKLRVNEERID